MPSPRRPRPSASATERPDSLTTLPPGPRVPAEAIVKKKKKKSKKPVVEEHPLLILECDASKLEHQGLTCADRVAAFARLLGVEPVVVKARTMGQVGTDLAAACENRVFDAVVVIAHGNSDGVKLTEDSDLTDWAALASWLGPLEPLRVAFIACQSARTVASSTLFDALESLDEVYASPLNMSFMQSHGVDFLLPCLLDGRMSDDWLRMVQAGQILLGRGLLFRYTRAEYENGDDQTDLAATMFEEHVLPDLARAGFEWLTRQLGPRNTR